MYASEVCVMGELIDDDGLCDMLPRGIPPPYFKYVCIPDMTINLKQAILLYTDLLNPETSTPYRQSANYDQRTEIACQHSGRSSRTSCRKEELVA